MLGRTHMAGGAVAGLLAAKALGYTGNTEVAMVGVAALAALLPDIDTPDSIIGHIIAPVSVLLNTVVGHRKLTHSLLAAVLAGAAASYIPGSSLPYVAAVMAGYLSHLLLDFLNPQGVPFFYPYPRRYCLPLTVTGAVVDNLLGALLGLVLLFSLFPSWKNFV